MKGARDALYMIAGLTDDQRAVSAVIVVPDLALSMCDTPLCRESFSSPSIIMRDWSFV